MESACGASLTWCGGSLAWDIHAVPSSYSPQPSTAQSAIRSFPLGSRSVQFEGAASVALCDDSPGTLSCILADSRTQSQLLVTAGYRQPAASTLADASTRAVIPGKAHSAHTLRSTATGSMVAVVLQSGDIAWLQPSLGTTAPPVMTIAPQPGADGLSALKLKAASSCCDTLAVLMQEVSGDGVQLRLFSCSDAASGVSAGRVLTVSCPAGTPRSAVDVRLATAYAVVLWSGGLVSIVKGVDGAPAGQVDISCSSIINGGSLRPHPSDVAAPDTASQEGRKRKPGRPAAPQDVEVLIAAVDASQLIVGSVACRDKAGSLGLSYSLLDSQFGCSIAQGFVSLDLPVLKSVFSSGPPSSRISTSPCSSVPPGLLIVQLGTAVVAVQIELPRACLLSLVGRMAVSEAAPSAAAGTNGRHLPLTPGDVCFLNVPVLRAAAIVSSAAGGAKTGSAARSSRPSVSVLRGWPEGAAAAAATVATSPDLKALLQELDDALLAPGGTPRIQAQTLQRALRQVSAFDGARLAHSGMPRRLFPLLARLLAEAGQWDGLLQVLQAPAMPSLPGASCSWLLPAAARERQYDILAPLCHKLDEVAAVDVAAAMAALLLPTSASNVADRKKHYRLVRARADALVALCEGRILSPRLQDRREAIALARCAAAAVDGFSYQDVLLHPLLAIQLDAPALQSCLSRLDNQQVDRLLSYLAIWVEKYLRLGNLAALVTLPPELLFPTLQQVLECACILLDSHLTRLLMAHTCPPGVGKLLACLRLQVSTCQKLLPLLGCTEHILHRAPLPAAAVSASARYTVQLLDLGVAG